MYLLSPPTSFEKIVSKLVRVRGRGLSVVQNLIPLPNFLYQTYFSRYSRQR